MPNPIASAVPTFADVFLFPPALVFLAAALLIPFLHGRARNIFLLAVPLVVFFQLLSFSAGDYWNPVFLDQYQLVMLRVEPIRMCFAYVYVIMAFLATVYALHEKEAWQHMAAFIYVGSSLGVALSGDYLTLFIFWEIMAVASGAIVLLRGTKSAREAGYRYLLVHIAGGACLMAGIVFQIVDTQSIALMTPGAGTAAFWLILLGFCLNGAVPPLSAWLSDAYPEASVTGSIYMTAYTTKTAVLMMALVFPGTEILIYAGVTMALYGVVFAVLENDIRRLLAYHIISQVGYMVCGVGLGTNMAINGVTAHAFCHILYKGLLFMGAGAVIYSTRRRLLTELGGIWRLMPWVFGLYMIGAFSISGFPLWNGFVSKSMIISAASYDHRPIIELLLLLASVGTFLHTGLKLPYYTFCGKNHGATIRRPLPRNMLWAMGGGAFFCTLFGLPYGYKILYNILPDAAAAAEYHPFTQDHVLGSLGLLIATGLAFMVFIRQLSGHEAITMDTDRIYRKLGNALVWLSSVPMEKAARKIDVMAAEIASSVTSLVRTPLKPPSKSSLTGHIVQGGVRDSIGFGVGLAVFIMVFFLFMFIVSGSY